MRTLKYDFKIWNTRRRSLSYRNKSIDLLRRSVHWFLYDRDLSPPRVKVHSLLLNRIIAHFELLTGLIENHFVYANVRLIHYYINILHTYLRLVSWAEPKYDVTCSRQSFVTSSAILVLGDIITKVKSKSGICKKYWFQRPFAIAWSKISWAKNQTKGSSPCIFRCDFLPVWSYLRGRKWLRKKFLRNFFCD